MPSPASQTIEEIRAESAAIRAELDKIYGSIRRGKFTDRKRVTAERRIKGRIDDLTKRAQRFYEQTLHTTFLSGAATAREGYTLTPEDMALLGKISDDGMTKIRTSNELAKRGVFRWGEVAEGSQWRGAAKRNMVRGMITTDGKRYHPDTYRTLVMAADAARTFNFGVLAGAAAAGTEHVIVRDGTGCGLTSHDDPQEANGMILTLDEARAHPIAHPYCQRTFEPYHGTRKPGSKIRKLAKTSAKVAAVGGVAAVAGGVTLKASPTLQLRLTELLAKANPEFLQYRSRVLQVAAATRREFDEITAELRAEMDEWILDDAHELSAQAQMLLGVKETTPRKVVGDTYDYIVDNEFRVTGERGLDLMNSVGGHTLGSIIDDAGGRVSYQLPHVLRRGSGPGAVLEGRGFRGAGRMVFDKDGIVDIRGAASQRLGDLGRIGVSQKGDHVVRYVNFTPNQMIRYRVSQVKYGTANRLVLNPNGMLRAGFTIDPRTGLVVPSLRFVPRGPIRIYNEVNRSRGTFQVGNIMANDLKKALSKKTTRKGVIEKGVRFEDVMRRGHPGQPGFLTETDFGDGQVREMFSVDGIIRRGRIPNALSVVDTDTNKRVRVDLIIRNGKFVKEHTVHRGRITSVSTTFQLSVLRSLKFNLRTNVNLRGLELDYLADIRHLRLHHLEKFHPARDFRIRSASLQLRMFGHSFFEISKILRMPWEDMKRFMQDAHNLMDSAYRARLWQKYETMLAGMVGGPGELDLTWDLVQRRLRSLPREAREAVEDVPGLLRDSAVALKREWVDDPIMWVMGTRERILNLRNAVDVKYKRPKVEPIYIDDLRNRSMLPKGERDNPRFLSKREVQTAEDLTNVLYLSPDELVAERIFDNVVDALRAQERAFIVIRDEIGTGETYRYPRQIEKHVGRITTAHDLDDLASRHFQDAAAKADVLNGLEPGTTSRMVSRDLHTILSYVEEQVPGLSSRPIKVRFVDRDQALAEYIMAGDVDARVMEAIVEGKLPTLARDVLGLNGEVWIDDALLNHWSAMRQPVSSRGWTVASGGMGQGMSTFLHELGHHLEFAGPKSEWVELDLEALFFGWKKDSDLNTYEWLEKYKGAVEAEIGSQYATENMWELVAEMWTFSRTFPGRSKIADAVYDVIKEGWS